MFTALLLETDSFCNRKCRWCVNGYEDRPHHTMPVQLVQRIAHELRDLSYSGWVGFNWFNEPLADLRLPDIVRCIRAACPESFLYVYTNGDYLTRDVAAELSGAGLDELWVMQYDGVAGEGPKAAAAAFPKQVSLRVVKDPTPLCNPRGGVVKHLIPKEPQQGRCLNPSQQLLVSASGDVPLCCNDPHFSFTAGNANDVNLKTMWDSPKFAEARERLARGDRFLDICKVCTIKG